MFPNLANLADMMPKMHEFADRILGLATELRDNQLVIIGNQQQIESKLDILLEKKEND